MKPKLRAIFVLSPEPEAQRELDAALDTLADALAEHIMARARAEVCGGSPPTVPGGTGSGEALGLAQAGGGR